MDLALDTYSSTRQYNFNVVISINSYVCNILDTITEKWKETNSFE